VISYTWTEPDVSLSLTTTATNGDQGCLTLPPSAPTFTVADACASSPTATVNTAGPMNTSGCTWEQTWTASYIPACGTAPMDAVITYTWNQPDINATLNIPLDIVVDCQNVPTNPTSGDATVTGVCGPYTIMYVGEMIIGTPNSCGYSIERTWSFENACGAIGSETQNITVNPSADPIFLSPPSNINLACGDPLPPTSPINYDNSIVGDCNIMGTTSSAAVVDLGATVEYTWSFVHPCSGTLNEYTQIISISAGPDISVINPSPICSGDSFDLNSLTINDANTTSASITFHSASPANLSNELPSAIVNPSITTTYYVLADANGCTDEASVSINVLPLPDLSTTDNPMICEGDNFDLTEINIIDANSTGAIYTFHSTSPATSTNELPSSIVTPLVTTTYTILGIANGCQDELLITVTVDQPVSPSFTQLGPYCVGDAADILPQNSSDFPAISGIWDGMISTATAGMITYTFMPDATQCASNTTMIITVNDCGCMDPASVSIDPIIPICEDELLSLNATIGGPASTVIWTTSGDGSFDNATSVSPIYTSGSTDIANGTVTITATTDDPDGMGPCSAVSTDVILMINSFTIPTFDGLGPYCIGDIADPLPTTSTNTPVIIGSWNTTISTTVAGMTNYVFTPDANQCASVTSMDIDVLEVATVLIEPINSICEGESISLISTIGGSATSVSWTTSGDGFFDNSNILNPVYTPGVTDIISGMSNLTVTTDDPDGMGSCTAASTDIQLVINQLTVPTFTQLGPYCIDDTGDLFSTISTNMITGEWDGPISTSAAGMITYTFTPDANQCASSTTMQIVVNDCGCMDPALITINSIMPICENETVSLTAVLGGSATTATWSSAGDGTFDNITSLTPIYTPGTTDISTGIVSLSVMTDDPDGMGPCVAIASDIQLIITEIILPSFSQLGPYCIDDIPDLLPTTSLNMIGGTWDGPIVTDAAGMITYTFTPNTNQCAATTSMEITVNDCACMDPAIVSINSIMPICEDETLSLTALLSGSATTVTWGSSGDGFFDDSNLLTPTYTPGTADISSGTVTLSVTTNDPDGAGPCVSITEDVILTINQLVVPSFDQLGPYCIDDVAEILPTTSLNMITGIWDGPIVTDAAGMLTYNFTPDANQCAATTSMEVTVSDCDCFISVNTFTIEDCEDNGTSDDSSDDVFSTNLIVEGMNIPVGSVYSVSWNMMNWGPFDYGMMVNIPGLPSNGTMITLEIIDDSGSCMTTLNVSQSACSPCIQTVDAGSNQTISCSEMMVTLTGSSSELGTPVWTDEGGMVVSNDLVFQTGLTGIYTLTVTFANQCIVSDVVTVDVDNGVPVSDPGAMANLTCLVDMVTLGGPNTTTGNGIEYIWTNQSGQVIGMDINLTTGLPGLYFLEVVDSNNNCSSPINGVEVIDGTNEPSAIIYSDPSNQINCIVSSVNLSTDDEVNVEYEWFTDDLTIMAKNIEVSVGGIVYLTAIDIITGCTNMDSIIIEDNIGYPFVDIVEPEELSCINSEVVIDANNSQTGTTISYQWLDINGAPLNGETGNNLAVSIPGSYILELVDSANGCTNQDTITVVDISDFPLVQVSADMTLGCTDLTLQLSGLGSETGNGIEYEWSTPNGNIVTGKDELNPIIDLPGTYYIEVLNSLNGCISLDSVVVFQNTNIPTDISVVINSPCIGETNGQILIDGVTGGSSPYTYTVGDETNTSGSFMNLAPGNYTVQVIDSDGCEYLTQLIMPESNGSQYEIMGENMLEYGQSSELSIVTTSNPSEIIEVIWSPEDSIFCLDPQCIEVEFIGDFSTNLFATIIDLNGCEYQLSYRMLVNIKENIYLPNIFSPDGNGFNDIFFIQSDNKIQMINEISIYDRWGAKLFQKENVFPNDPSNGWDGTFKNQPVAAGVYAYRINYTTIFGDEVLKIGEVSIIK